MQSYICKCGKRFLKNSSAATTGYVLENYQKGHECFGCPYIVEYEDWQTKEITKRECRATPKLDYTTYCRIGTEDKDFSAAYFYTLDLLLAKRVYQWCQQLDGCVKIKDGVNGGYSSVYANSFPEKWRAADFDNEHGLIKFPLVFENNKKGTAARRDIAKQFFNRYRNMEKETVITKIQIAIAKANGTMEGLKMQNFNFNPMLSQANQVKQIPLDMLVPYYNHKFKLYDGERLNDMVESIKQNGVLNPIIVRPIGGKYEILAGHNRTNAATLAGLTSVPAVIKENLSDDEAQMYVIETNLMQRGFDDLRISEQASVLAMRHSQMFSEEKRAEILSELSALEGNSPLGNSDNKVSKLEKVGDEYGMSKNSVARLIRIDTLIEPLKEWVDDKTISIRAAVELSYVSDNAQKVIHERLSSFPDVIKIDIKFAQRLRDVYAGFCGTVEQAYEIFGTILKCVSLEDKKPKAVKIKPDVYSRFFPEDTSADEIEETIEQALAYFFTNKVNIER